MRQKIIHIEWEGPLLLESLNKLNNPEFDYGVYQIYGSHPVYGSNLLLYIGKADKQNFYKRISKEWWEYNKDASQIQVYVGRLAGEKTPDEDEWSRQIDLSERLLIYAHAPAHNSRSLLSIPDADLRNVHILTGVAIVTYFLKYQERGLLISMMICLVMIIMENIYRKNS